MHAYNAHWTWWLTHVMWYWNVTLHASFSQDVGGNEYVSLYSSWKKDTSEAIIRDIMWHMKVSVPLHRASSSFALISNQSSASAFLHYTIPGGIQPVLQLPCIDSPEGSLKPFDLHLQDKVGCASILPITKDVQQLNKPPALSIQVNTPSQHIHGNKVFSLFQNN